MDTATLTHIRFREEDSHIVCCADMIINGKIDNPIKVEITHPNKENWFAYCHQTNKSYDLNIEGRNSILDLQNGDVVEIFCSASPQATFSR